MRLYFDSNIFIYAFEAETDLGHAARKAFELLDDDRAIGATSEMTLAEILPYPLRRQDVQLEHAYESIFAGRAGLETYPLTLAILRRSARLVAQLRLRSIDAVHVATALSAACDSFLTEDRNIRVPEGMRLIRLADPLFA